METKNEIVKPEEQRQDSAGLLNKLTSAIEGLNSRLEAMEARANSRAPAIPQDEIIVYESKPKTLESEILEEPRKSNEEIYEETRRELLRERANFLHSQGHGNAMDSFYNIDPSRGQVNAHHFHECAFLQAYENGGKGFKKFFKEEYELLKNGHYAFLLESAYHDEKAREKFLGAADYVNNRDPKFIAMTNLARNYINKTHQGR